MDRYGTPEGARERWEEQGREVPVSWTDDTLDAGLLVVSEFLDGRYGAAYPGIKTNGRSQVRLWPRTGAADVNGDPIDPNEIPVEMLNATYEALWMHRTSPGSLSVNVTPSKYKSASVTGAVAVTYNTFNSAADAQPMFYNLDLLLANLLSQGSGSFSSLSGATSRV